MQFKFLAVAAALAFSSVEAGTIKERASVSGGYIVFPEVVFDLAELYNPYFRALEILRNDINKTANLMGELNRQTGTTINHKAEQANAVVRQATANVNNIRIRIGFLVGVLESLASGVPGAVPTLPPAPSVDVPNVGAIAEDLVRTAQFLARTAAQQLEILRSQLATTTDFAARIVLQTAITNANLAIGIILTTVNAAGNTLFATVATGLTTGAVTIENANAVAERVRNAQIRFTPVLVLTATPDVTF